LSNYDTVLVPELNNGQLATLLRDKLVLSVEQLNQVNGQPLAVHGVKQAIARLAPKRIKQAG
jgi:2-oxoglutarate ferredoxin oxidoreductase subunit alpha